VSSEPTEPIEHAVVPSGPEGPIDRSRLVYRWDLDKTYLRTEFDTLRDLLSRAFERAADKRTVPGAAALLREIRGAGPAGLFILSGSPEQMRRVLEAKLRLDGIRWDGFTLKPQLRNLLRGHFKFLRDQVGYKLGAMLASREPLAVELDEILFGDDAENDVFIYSLYADIIAGRVSNETLLGVLQRAAVTEEQIPELMRLVARLPKRPSVRHIFIHLDRMSPLDTFAAYGPRVCPFYNYFQPALVLVEAGALDARAALRVAADLVIDQGFTADALAASFAELGRRGQVGERARDAVCAALSEMKPGEYAGAEPSLRALLVELKAARAHNFTPVMPEALDYVALLAEDRARAKTAKLRVLSRR
jgi:hypothetical protein